MDHPGIRSGGGGRSRDGWIEERTLGSGGFGTVTMWKNEETGQCIALKRIRMHNEMSPNVKTRWEMECRIMQKLNHDNVIRAFPVPPALDVRDSDMPLLAMEYCESGDLRKVLSRPENSCGLGEFQVRTIVKHIASAIEYLHSMKIIHRDLKPENVVITQVDERKVYKLIDLGYAKDLEQGSVCTSFVGTMQYLAPELFQSQRYTQTVDFWSFGILMFECCAGFRPFLHHMPPVSWQSIVCKKSKEDIHAYTDENNKVIFSKFIPSPNYLSRTTQLYMEHWLRMMLSWDPKERGGPLTSSSDPSKPNRVSCFEILSKILETRLMHVFVGHQNLLISYPLHGPDTRVRDVMDVIAKEVRMPVEDQELLLANGAPVDEEAPAFQYVTDEPNEEMSDWIVFLFNKNSYTFPATERAQRPLPTHASQLASDPRSQSLWQEQRQTWSHALYFCRQAARDYKILLDAERAAMLSLLRFNSNFTKLRTQLSNDVASLQSKIDLFNKCHDFDSTKYLDQASYGISSDKMFANWNEMDTQVRKFGRLKQEVKSVEQQAASINVKVMELNRSPFAKNQHDKTLQDVADEALALCTELRNRPYEKRSKKSDNAPMTQCLHNCLHNRTKLTDDVYNFLERVLACRSEVITLLPRVQSMCEIVREASRRLVTYQLQRQKDMWQLISASIRQSKQLQDKLTKQQKLHEQLQQQLHHVQGSGSDVTENHVTQNGGGGGSGTEGPPSSFSRSSSSSGGQNFNLTLSPMPSVVGGGVGGGSGSGSGGDGSLNTPSGQFFDKISQLSMFSMQNNEKLRKELSLALQGMSMTPTDDAQCDWEFLLQKRTHTC